MVWRRPGAAAVILLLCFMALPSCSKVHTPDALLHVAERLYGEAHLKISLDPPWKDSHNSAPAGCTDKGPRRLLKGERAPQRRRL